jgi:DNA polymerase
MDSRIDHQTARAMLAWHIECGADEAILDAPIDRYGLDAVLPKPAALASVAASDSAPEAAPTPVDPAQIAAAMAANAADLPTLRDTMDRFPYCELRQGARNFVFADGRPDARVMIVGEAPGREEDLEGRPFVGRAGQLLDRMLGAIDMARDAATPEQAVYITNVLPWRPPGNRTPEAGEIAMMLPFLERHIALADPEIVILMGNVPCQALLGRVGITRLRGQWTEVLGRPALPMVHPAYLLRQPAAKREAWADLLSLKARLLGL